MKNLFKYLIIIIIINACSNKEEEIAPIQPKLISFSIKEISSNFNITESTIETTLKDEQDLTDLTAIFKVSENTKVFVNGDFQTSGYSRNDFSNTVTYTLESEDGTKAVFLVSINLEAKLKTFKIVELSNVNFTISDLNITANVPSGTSLDNLTADFTLTPNSDLYINGTIQESGETKNNFEAPIKYELKDASGEIKEYTVTITEDPNNEPVADAGFDKVLVLPQNNSLLKVNLDGSKSSDVEAPILKFEWQLNGSIIGNEAFITTELGIGIYAIQLIVTDTSGDTNTDIVNVEIKPESSLIYLPIDANATLETKALYKNIATLANGQQFAFGQEFPMSFQLNNLRSDLSTSDCKDVVGDHPAVYGIDPHYMLYKGETQKQLHIDEAKYAYNNGSVVTFDFHQKSRTDGKVYYDAISTESDKSLMYDIVNDLNGSRSWFFDELDQVVDIINNDLGFPIVFRLFHEMDGGWFWWGTQATNHSPQLYIDLYKLATDYIKNRTDLVLFGWTPNQQIIEGYYPGDNYVDVVGIDVYNPVKVVLKENLIGLSNFALNHSKVAILSETGKTDYVNSNPTFWTSNVLAAIKEGGSDIRIAWALAWFNAPWRSNQSDLFIPNGNSSSQVKEDFINFFESPFTLFQQETSEINIYE